MKHSIHFRKQLALLLVLAPAIAGCSSSSDLFSGDANWFSRYGRLSIRSVSIDTPPLTPDKPITPDDLVSAEGACPGMPAASAPADASAPVSANASTDGVPGAPPPTAGTVALGHTECDVVRGIGAPDNVNISKNERGDRLAVVTWTHGSRAGIYTFTAGRLSSIEGMPEVPASPKARKSRTKSVKSKKKPAAT